MGARAEALAKQFETKAKDATAVLERLSEADWKKTTATEKWPVGVVAHHVAGGYEAIAGIVKTTKAPMRSPIIVAKARSISSGVRTSSE